MSTISAGPTSRTADSGVAIMIAGRAAALDPFLGARPRCRRTRAQVVEVPGSHSVYVSRPGAVADIIKQAADA